jgi:hypothetical protein
VDSVLRRIEMEPAGLEPRRNRHVVIKWLLATAASLAVVAVLWWAFHSDKTLYAQAIDGIKRARTVYIATTVRADADHPAEIVTKAWYERGVGFREEQDSEVRLGNQNSFWTYLKDSNLAIRAKSRGLEDIVDRMLNSDALADFKRFGKTERFPDADQTIAGQSCKAYLLIHVYPVGYPIEAQQKDEKGRSLILLDEQSRIIRGLYEMQLKDGWVVLRTSDWKYDVPIDRTLFEPKFGDEVKIVDADHVFDDFVNLDKAVYHEERAGLLFAIHRLERFGDGIYIVSSVRGTEETLKKYPLKLRVGTGSVFEEGPAANYEASPLGDRYFRIDLARADYHGINVCWWVLVPRGAPLSRFDTAPGMVKLPIGITPQGDFAKDNFAKNDVIQHLTWDLVLSLPQAAALPSIETIAAQAYSDQVALEAIPVRRLDMGPKDNLEQFSRPEKTTAVQFGNAVAAHIRYWRDEDVNFQLQGQFEAIGLMYEPTVDDATLARVAKRESLKRLYLDGTKITDAGLRQLVGLKELRELNLSHTSITDAGLKELEGLTSLRTLDVKDTKVTADGVARMKAAIPGLKVIP